VSANSRESLDLSTEIDQVFIMRFWREAGFDDPNDPRRWRARISHVNTGEHFHAEDMEKAFLKIDSVLNFGTSARDQVS
jgi:hypothetical protein